jgi:hypothetical protein
VIANDSGGVEVRDGEQALLLECLRAACGTPVDFAELRAHGIEHPAVLSYELEAAGVPIVRALQWGRQTLALDTRSNEHAPLASPAPRAARPTERVPDGVAARVTQLGREYRHAATARAMKWTALARRPLRRSERAACAAATLFLRRRPPPVVALVVGAIAAAAIAAALSSGSARMNPNALTHHKSRHTHLSARAANSRAPRPVVPASAHPAPAVSQVLASLAGGNAPTHPSLAAAVAMETAGHQLLADGGYARAIDRLLGAIRASGQSLATCREPTGEACLTFAYALYDLGRALRLEREQGAAITVLSDRLGIDNQRPVVEHELELARGA